MGRRDAGISWTNPFAAPAEHREPARRLRGRLAAPVTVWTAGEVEAGTGLTVSSVLVAEGEPPQVIGLLSDLADLLEVIEVTGAFVVHVLERGDQQLADRFAGRIPVLGGTFDGLRVSGSPYGPVLHQVATRASCRFTTSTPAGHATVVHGVIEQVEVHDLEEPLVYFRGRYRRLHDPR